MEKSLNNEQGTRNKDLRSLTKICESPLFDKLLKSLFLVPCSLFQKGQVIVRKFLNLPNRISLVAIFLFFILLFFSHCSNSFSDGKYLYEQHCQSCHMEDGAGLAGLIPPLAKSDYLKNNFEKLPCIILLGIDEEIEVNGKTYDRPMVGIGDLETFEVVLIINYINHSWGNDAKYTDFREVEANLQNCQ